MSSTNTAPTTTEATNSKCNDITLDVCGNADQTTPFETVKLLEGQEEKVCQEICRDVYPVDRCIFFIYDREDRLCQLFDFDEQIYVDSCKKIAATPKPDLAECKESNDPCTVRQQLQQSDILLDPVQKLYQKLSFYSLYFSPLFSRNL